MNKKSEDRGSGKGFDRGQGQREKKWDRGEGRGEGAGRLGGEAKQDRDFSVTDDLQQVQAESSQEFEAATYREQGREERDRQGGKSDYRQQVEAQQRQVEAQQLPEAATKSGCLPKLFMLLMSFAAVGAALFLRS